MKALGYTMKICGVLLSALLVLRFSGAAQPGAAGDLIIKPPPITPPPFIVSDAFTPPLVVFGTPGFLCTLVNVSSTTQEVVVEARNDGGSLVSGCSNVSNPFTASVGAGEVIGMACPGPGESTSELFYCHFRVLFASTTAIRGSMELFASSGGVVLAIPAQ